MIIPSLKKEDEEKVSEALHDVWGIRDVVINSELNEVKITYNTKSGSLHDFEQAIKDIGYDDVQSSNERG